MLLPLVYLVLVVVHYTSFDDFIFPLIKVFGELLFPCLQNLCLVESIFLYFSLSYVFSWFQIIVDRLHANKLIKKDRCT